MTVSRVIVVFTLCDVLAACNGGNGLTMLAPVTPAQGAVVGGRVAATSYYVELHPLDAPDLQTLRKLHDDWHAGGIRIDYDPTNSPAFYDRLVSQAKAVGLKLILVTPYTTLPVNTPAYAHGSGTAAKRYAGNGITWEIYNEPDLLFGNAVADYVAFAKATALAIRSNDPSATILTGGTSGKDQSFPFAIAAGKALAPYVDGVAIHPYGVDYGSMGAAIVKVSLATGEIVHITEWATPKGEGLGQAMVSAKGLTPTFCVYEYQEQPAEKQEGDPIWGLIDTGAWSAFAAAATQ